MPEKAGAPFPLVVWIHGGAWKAGSKANPRALPLLEAGFAVAAINYRYSSEAVFPAQIEDCRAAIRFLRAHAAQYRIDPKAIGVWGSPAVPSIATRCPPAEDPQTPIALGSMRYKTLLLIP